MGDRTPVISRRGLLTGGRGGEVTPPRVAIGETCLTRLGVVCQACRDACPENAVRFPPALGRVASPVIAQDACTACGACAPACPTAAIRVEPAGGTARHGL